MGNKECLGIYLVGVDNEWRYTINIGQWLNSDSIVSSMQETAREVTIESVTKIDSNNERSAPMNRKRQGNDIEIIESPAIEEAEPD